jgi:hypothetical protein
MLPLRNWRRATSARMTSVNDSNLILPAGDVRIQIRLLFRSKKLMACRDRLLCSHCTMS